MGQLTGHPQVTIWGFFMKRISYLVDGFNLYHSVKDLKRDTGYSTKWLDVASLCKSYLPLFGKDAGLETIYYFSAIPYYLVNQYPDKIQRQQDYLSCLESTGIKVEMGRFKEKDVYCYRCKSMILKHEEKETDVAMAVKVVELFLTGTCDNIVIVSGDTDLSPAIRKCQTLKLVTS